MNDSKVIATYGLSSPYEHYLFCLQFMNDSIMMHSGLHYWRQVLVDKEGWTVYPRS
jgi:hypothetical protein